MSTKAKVVISITAALVLFAVGRYSVPVKTITKTIEVEKKVIDKTKKVDKEKHMKTIIVEETKPDGTKVVTTTIVEDTETKSDTDVVIHDDKKTDTTKEVIRASGNITIAALAGTKVSLSSGLTPIYGGMIDRNLIGPITIGAFGLSDGVVGGALGLRF